MLRSRFRFRFALISPLLAAAALLLPAILLPAADAKVEAKAKAKIRVVRDLEFARVNGVSLKLDLHLPQNVSRPPLLVWIHGGGWRGGSRKRVHLVEMARHGFAIASISYRFSKTAVFPAQIHDCKAAIRWLRANAQRLGYAANRIGVAGSSAGGHLALLVGVSGGVKELEGTVGGNLDQSSTVQAVIDYFGPSDFVLRGKTQPDRAYSDKSGSFALLGGQDGQDGQDGQGGRRLDPRIEAFASPATYVTADDPPLLVFQGSRDTVVLPDQSERIVKLHDRLNLPAALVMLDKSGHGGKPFFTGEHLETARAFLDRHLR